MSNQNYEEDWAVYFSPIHEGKIGSILVDLGFNNVAPIKSQPNLITVKMFMNNPAEDGLSSAEENPLLNQIEDYYIELIVKKYRATYPGRLKYDGQIFSYFYSERTDEIENIIEKIRVQYSNYRFEYNVIEEKDWNAYFEVLYPSPMEMQSIQNALVIENLEKHGDKLEKERQVDHWIYFNSISDRENFIEAIKEDGFEIENKNKISDEENPFQLHISRTDKVDYQSVDDYVLYLWEKAQEFNGDYDGWETFVIKD